VDKHRLLRRLGILIKLVVVPAFLGVLAVKLFNDPRLGLFKVDPIFIVVALLVNQIALFLFALRMRLVLRVFDVKISYIQSLRIHLQSMLYYFILPMTVGLEVARFAKIKSILGNKTQAATLGSALVADRLTGAIAALIWAAVLLPTISVKVVTQRDWKLPVIFILGGCIGLMVIVSLHGKIRLYVKELVRLCRSGRKVLWLALMVAMLTQLFFSLGVYFAARGGNLDITFIQTLFAISAAMLFIVIPISFAGVSPVEAAGVGIMVGMGVPVVQAAIFALFVYLAKLIAAFEGGAWELYEGGGHVSRRLFAKVVRGDSDNEHI